MQLQDYIFYCHSNYLKNYKEIMRARCAQCTSYYTNEMNCRNPRLPRTSRRAGDGEKKTNKQTNPPSLANRKLSVTWPARASLRRQ